MRALLITLFGGAPVGVVVGTASVKRVAAVWAVVGCMAVGVVQMRAVTAVVTRAAPVGDTAAVHVWMVSVLRLLMSEEMAVALSAAFMPAVVVAGMVGLRRAVVAPVPVVGVMRGLLGQVCFPLGPSELGLMVEGVVLLVVMQVVAVVSLGPVLVLVVSGYVALWLVAGVATPG